MALNPDEVDLMDTEAMQAKAEAALREQAASLAKEDFSGKKLVQKLLCLDIRFAMPSKCIKVKHKKTSNI